MGCHPHYLAATGETLLREGGRTPPLAWRGLERAVTQQLRKMLLLILLHPLDKMGTQTAVPLPPGTAQPGTRAEALL